MLTRKVAGGLVLAVVLTLVAVASRALDPEYYQHYKVHTRQLKNEVFSCPSGQVNLRELLHELRPVVDEMLVAQALGDVGSIVDLSKPTEIAAKTINRDFYVRYLFYELVSQNVLPDWEGGVYVVVKPCERRVVDVLLFHLP